MGLLDQVIGGVVGQVLGGGRGGAMSPIVKALLMLLLAKGASGGFGDIFGGGHAAEPAGGGEPRGRGRPPSPEEYDGPRGDDGDLGGFGRQPQGGDAGGGDFSDLSGMLDGPGDAGRSPGAGPYAHLDHERDGGSGSLSGGSGGLGGGLDGLIESFERGGLGDVIGSWIGHGQNRAIEPNRLADALGPDTVDALSSRTGLDRSDLLNQLAQALPSVVDALTPQGRRPRAEEQRNW